jgi:hypothetical protein
MSYGEELLCQRIKLSFNEDSITVRPKYLFGLEIDQFLKKFKVGFEFQGEQHYTLVGDFNMTNNDFLRRILYDIQKDIFCKREEIVLVKINPVSLKSNLFRMRIGEAMANFYGLKPVSYIGRKKEVVGGVRKVVKDVPIYFTFKNQDNLEFLSAPHKKFIKLLYHSNRNDEISQKFEDLDFAITEYRKKLWDMGCRFSTVQQHIMTLQLRDIFGRIKDVLKSGKTTLPLDKYIKGDLSLKEIVDYGTTMIY